MIVRLTTYDIVVQEKMSPDYIYSLLHNWTLRLRLGFQQSKHLPLVWCVGRAASGVTNVVLIHTLSTF